jgi:hypothetical protein
MPSKSRALSSIPNTDKRRRPRRKGRRTSQQEKKVRKRIQEVKREKKTGHHFR